MNIGRYGNIPSYLHRYIMIRVVTHGYGSEFRIYGIFDIPEEVDLNNLYKNYKQEKGWKPGPDYGTPAYDEYMFHDHELIIKEAIRFNLPFGKVIDWMDLFIEHLKQDLGYSQPDFREDWV